MRHPGDVTVRIRSGNRVRRAAGLSAGPGAKPCRKGLILSVRTGGRRLCRGWTALSSLPTHLSLSWPRSEAFAMLHPSPVPCWGNSALRGLGTKLFSWFGGDRHSRGSAIVLNRQTSGEALLNLFVCVIVSACIINIINRTAYGLSAGRSHVKYQTGRVKSVLPTKTCPLVRQALEGKEV